MYHYLFSLSVIHKTKVMCKKHVKALWVILFEQILSPVSAEVKLFLYFVEVHDDVFGGKEGLMLAYRSPFSVVNGSVSCSEAARQIDMISNSSIWTNTDSRCGNTINFWLCPNDERIVTRRVSVRPALTRWPQRPHLLYLKDCHQTLRRIFGIQKGNNRKLEILRNEVLHNAYSSPNIIRIPSHGGLGGQGM
jgi:hypothetical protein